MTSYVTPKKNSAFIMYAALVDASDSRRFKSGPTIASGDFKVSKDGGAFATLTNLPVATGVAVQLSLTSTEMNADNVTISCIDQTSPPEWLDQVINVQTSARQIDDLTFPATTGRSMVVDASGLVDANAVKVGPTGSGTAQTARDIGASVLLSAGSGAGQLDFTAGVVKANLAQILGTVLTETAGQIAAAFKKVFDVASATFTALSVNQTGDSYARLGAPAGASHAADVAAVKTDTAAVKVQTDKLAFTVANQVDSNVIDWKGSAAPAMTGDAYARLGAPAGASVSADVAAIKSDTGTILTDVNTGAGAIYTRLGAPAGASIAADIAAVEANAVAIKAKTDNLPASPAAVSSVPTANQNADALLDRADGVETGLTFRSALRLFAAALVGKSSGLSTTSAAYRDVNDTKNRIVATVDVDGNRSAVTKDVS